MRQRRSLPSDKKVNCSKRYDYYNYINKYICIINYMINYKYINMFYIGALNINNILGPKRELDINKILEFNFNAAL